MGGMEIAAIIAAATTLVLGVAGLIGGAVRYVISLILNAYKEQTKATVEAKDRDLNAKDKLIEKLERRVEKLDENLSNDAELISTLTATVKAQNETILHHETTNMELTRVLRALGEPG